MCEKSKIANAPFCFRIGSFYNMSTYEEFKELIAGLLRQNYILHGFPFLQRVPLQLASCDWYEIQDLGSIRLGLKAVSVFALEVL